MKSKKLPFSKPKPNHKCKLYSFGSHIDLETTSKERKKNTKISRYKKISKHEVLDTVTNRVILCNSNVVKNEKIVFKQFKGVSRVVLTNFLGTDAEILTRQYYREQPINTYTDWQYCFRKLERRAKQKLLYIVVLQYQNDGLPRLERLD